MALGFDLQTLHFQQPMYLRLLVVPAALFLAWCWRSGQRWRDARRLHHAHMVPVRERLGSFGGLLFWLCVLLSLALTILALAQPTGTVVLVRQAGVDLIVLQDGSASMHVRDVSPDRWGRSVKFLHVLAESLQWTNDRVALALFAHIAAPQIRLTRDPNTFFFFLDHLGQQSPFRLEDDMSWDTNIELGLHWGIRLIDKDEELHGRSPNPKAFVLVSDGQAWSGEIQRALGVARSRDVPVFVVGVGTLGGGVIPEPEAPISTTPRPLPQTRLRSSLDATSLRAIANAAGGSYFSLAGENDRAIAAAIISTTRRRAGTRGLDSTTRDLHWYCLYAAGLFLCLSVLGLSDRGQLGLLAAASGVTLILFWQFIS